MLYRQGLTSIGSPGTASRCAVRTSIPPRLRLTTQVAELVAQYENLELLAIGRAAEQDQEPEDPAKSDVQKREHASPPVGWQRRGKLPMSDGC